MGLGFGLRAWGLGFGLRAWGLGLGVCRNLEKLLPAPLVLRQALFVPHYAFLCRLPGLGFRV
jgi:type IV secretory pathway TrbD component